MNLRALQQAFQAHVLQQDAQIAPQLTPQIVAEGVPEAVRLGVYHHAYVARLVEVLAETYPAVQAALGSEAFSRFGASYVYAHPSRFHSARAYGADFNRWLGSRMASARGQGLADLARLEWLMAAAFDAAEGSALAPEQLTRFAPQEWPRLCFGFSPSVQRLKVASNAIAWWRHGCAAARRPSRWRATAVGHWLIWRQQLAVYYRRLSAEEAQLIDAARAGQSFARLCEHLPDPTTAATLLHRWLKAGLLVSATVQADTLTGA